MPVELARANGANQRGALDQFVARGGEEAALRLRADPVARAADALQRDRDRARRADLADQIDGSDVDAELERSRRDHRPQLAVLQTRLGVQAQSWRERLP